MTGILAKRADEKRRAGEVLIREADNLGACLSNRIFLDEERAS
jgi:hypothetical protein